MGLAPSRVPRTGITCLHNSLFDEVASVEPIAALAALQDRASPLPVVHQVQGLIRHNMFVPISNVRRVFVFPVNGYINRLQAVASSALLAEHLGATLRVCWTPFTMVPGPVTDTVAPQWCESFCVSEEQVSDSLGVTLADIPLYVSHNAERGWVGLRGHDRGEQALMGELARTLDLALTQGAGPIDLVIVAGGSFDLSDATAPDGAWSDAFLRAKASFYRALPLHPAIESAAHAVAAEHPSGFLGLHLRYSDRAHQAPTPWAIRRAIEAQAAATGLSDVFVASDSPRAREQWSQRLSRMGLSPFDLSDHFADLATATSAGPALADWRLLSLSQRLVYFAESSYSVEASVASGSWAQSSALATSRPRALAQRGLTLARAALTYPSRHWFG